VPVWPAGYRVCGYDTVLDLPTYVLAANRSYAGLWGHRDVGEDDIASFLQQTAPRLDGTFLLFGPAGEVAGFCRAELNAACSARYGEPTGSIDSPGLTPEHHHRPLRRPLLLTAWRWLRANGQAGAELESFGDDEATLRDYAALGFVVTRRLVGQERRLPTAQEA
jgi:ribosomal protein S18 acetylase RimI-like enzyme